MGKTIVYIGLALIAVGILVHFSEGTQWFRKLGNLPGDIKVEKENFRFYAPLGSSILLSVVLSFVFFLWRKFFG